MEEKESSASGVAARGEEAPESFRFAPINENPSQSDGPTVQPATVPATPSPANAAVTGTQGKKKRGRPRKYAPDGTVSLALSPMPISSSIPLTGDFSWKQRGRVRPIESIKKSQKYETFENSGQRISYSVGANFTPHVLTVNAGEDVTMKVMSFSQQGARAICILSANGTISNVTLRQPTSSGGTLTYEGRFEILSLSGSFMPTENAGTKSRSGGMSVSLAGPDGRVMGGGLAGLLIAAGPVQVVVGSFLPGHQQEQKPKKQRVESISAVSLPIVTTISSEEIRGGYGVKPIMTSTGFHADNSSSLNTIQGYKNSAPENKEDSSPLNHPLNHPIQGYNNSIPENKSSLAEEESKGLSQPNCEVSC